MADSLSIEGTLVKSSGSRAQFSLALDVAEDLDGDNGAPTFSIVAGASQAITLDPVTPADFIYLRTTGEVAVTLTLDTGTFAAVPVRGMLAMQIEGLTAVTIDNTAGTKTVSIILATSKRVATS